MSILETAKAKAAKGNLKGAFTNESGAIDLASIMVGIIVIGLIGGVIAATVFAIIPWAQDNAAKQQLDSVAAAESAFIGKSADASAITFGTLPDLSTASLLPSTTKVKIGIQGTGTDAHYISIVKSASGKYFYITDTKTQPTEAGTSGAATVAQVSGTNIPGGTSINGVTWGTGGGTPVNTTLTGSF